MNKYMTTEELFEALEQPLTRREQAEVYAARAGNRVRDIRLSFVRAWQRWRRGYAEEDTWSFHYFLTGVIVGGVEALRRRQIGYPVGMTPGEWDAILASIVRGFRAAQKDPMDEDDWKAYSHAMALFSTYYFDLWD
jgi:hypothetical protein